MSTTGTRIQTLLDDNKNEVFSKLRFQWENGVTESNDIISNINYNTDYQVSDHIEEIYNMIERLDRELVFYEELGVDIDQNTQYNFIEIRRNLEDNYRKLSLVYYKHNFENFNKQISETIPKLENLENKQQDIKNNMTSLDNKIENLGATFLNIVLTISITSTMITLLTKVKEKYTLVIVLSCAWLLLTCIIFIASYFKANNEHKFTFSKLVYILLTVITVITFGIVSSLDIKDYIDKKRSNIKIEDNNLNNKIIDTTQ